MLHLIKDRTSDYRIILRSSHSLSEQTAAEELSSYLKKISGAELPVFTDDTPVSDHEICIGYTNRLTGEDYSSLGDEGYIIRTAGDRLFLLGSGVRGALYCVYTFLEKFCNCRFYTNDFERVPAADSIVLDNIDLREVPFFAYRNSYWYDQSGEFISAKLKINDTFRHALTDRVGGGLGYAGGFVHTLEALSEKDTETAAVLCLCDEEIYQTVLANAKKTLRNNPSSKIISISQSDGNSGGCTCEKCLAVNAEEQSGMGTMLRFVNRIQADIREEFPGVHVDTIAYQYTIKPPVITKPDPDVVIRLCTNDCGHRHPFATVSPELAWGNDTIFYDTLKAWSKLANHLYVWDYIVNFAVYSAAHPNFDTLWENIRLFAENKAIGVFEQGNIESPDGEFGALKGYLIARLLWNPMMSKEDYRHYMREFLDDYYGDAGKWMQEFIDYSLECSVHSNFGAFHIYSNDYLFVPGTGSVLEGEKTFLAHANELFDNAEKAVEDDPLSYAHVRQSRIQLYIYHFYLLRKMADGMKPSPEKAVINAEIVQIHRMTFREMRKYKFTHSCEFRKIDFENEPDWATVDAHGWGYWVPPITNLW
ncbi:MAG: DUF4838 domain-containing protein [Ruminococcaceae bacterium]|nr:DUF4838 domain-containing protein [Oscillospiraceae bacterium]